MQDNDFIFVVFEGSDVSNNQIVDVYWNSNKNNSKFVNIPCRINHTGEEWVNLNPIVDGKDYVKIPFNKCSKNLLTHDSGIRSTPDCDALTAVSSSINYISCKNAEITLAGTGFVPSNFNISWTDRAGINLPQFQNQAHITVTNAGTYCYKIEAINDCCEMEGCIEVIEEEILHQDFNLPIFGHTDCDKELVAIWDSNKFEYLYSWSNGQQLSSQNDNTTFDPGEYTVTITNRASGCIDIEEFEYIDLDFTLNGAANQASCGQSESITLDIAQNDTRVPINYLWSDGDTNESRYDLEPGHYCVTVTSGEQILNHTKRCAKTMCFDINPIPFNVSVLTNLQKCEGYPDLVLSASMSNGSSGTFRYLWDDGSTSSVRSISQAGHYCYTVTEVNTGTCVEGCYDAKYEKAIGLKTLSKHICTQGTGQVTTEVTGINGPFTYIWSNGSTTSAITGLNAGTYTVTVTDRNKCTATEVSTISNLDLQIDINFIESFISCSQRDLGLNYVLYSNVPNVYQYIAPLAFKWSTGETVPNIIVEKSGQYCVTITTANNCTFTACTDVSLDLKVEITSTQNTLCPTPPADGSISVKVEGGKPPYKYTYIPGPSLISEPTLKNLTAGNYNVIVTDAYGCTNLTSVSVNSSSPFEFSIKAYDICLGNTTGSVEVIGQYGYYYIYQLLPNGQSALVKSFFGGNTKYVDFGIGKYYIKATSHNGCQSTIKYFEIKQSQNPPITNIDAEVICIVNNEAEFFPGAIMIKAVNGGSQPFTYEWSTTTSDNKQNINVTEPGIYTVTVTDKNGCYITKEFDVKQTTQSLFANVNIINKANCNPKEVTFEVEMLSGNPPYTITIGGEETVTNSKVIEITKKILDAKWDVKTYQVDIKDDCGLKEMKTISAVCTSICPDNCIKFYLSSFLTSGCVKLSYDPVNTFEAWLFPTKLNIECTCNDNVARQVDWHHVTNGSKTFVGKGHYSENLQMIGWLDFKITNLNTGCIQYHSFITPKACKSPWKWLADTFGGGAQPTDPKSPCEGYDKEFVGVDSESCEEIFRCIKFDQEYQERKPKEKKKCSVRCDEGGYANFAYCPLDCEAVEFLDESLAKKYNYCKPCVEASYVVTNHTVNQFCSEFVKPPVVIEPTCQDQVKCVIYDTLYESYIGFFNRMDSVKNKKMIYGYMFENSSNITDFGAFSAVESNLDVEDVKMDSDQNQYILGKDGNQFYEKFDKFGNKSWSMELVNFNVVKVIQNANTYSLIGFDNLRNVWLNKTFDENGSQLSNLEMSIGNLNYSIVDLVSSTTAGYDPSTKLIHFMKNSNNRVFKVPDGIVVKNISSLANGKFYVIGEIFNQELIMNKLYDPGQKVKPIVLIFDNGGSLLKIKMGSQSENYSVYSGFIKNDGEAVLFGYENSECNYIWFYSLDDQCPPFTSILTYDHRACQLAWDAAPAGYTTQLQMQVNSIWIPAEKALGIDITPTSPFAITRDGSYRLLHTKVGCPDIISNVVATTCTNGCVCPSPVLSYDPTTCVLTWSITECIGYTISLQRLNTSNTWETVVQQASSPYTVAVNGSYRLSLMKGFNTVGTTCAAVQSNTVVTACTPSTNACVCTAPVLNHNTSTCQLTWTASSCAGYTTTLQRSVAGVWTTVNATSPYSLPTNTNGQYRLVTSKAGCSDLYSVVVNVTCTCTSPASITIYNYGSSGLGQNATIQKGQSFTHNITQGSPDACDESFIQLAFTSSVVNSTWSFYVNGTVAVMPGVIVGNQYIVDLYLPTPPSGGTADVFMQSPCGDFYQLHLVYDCVVTEPCPTINVSVTGNLNNSCENLTINASGGASLYTYQIDGTGSQGTVINQTGSSNVIDLSTLIAGEYINLEILVSDTMGCVGALNKNYIKCSTACNGNTCGSNTPECNETLGQNSGYNNDAIINFLVPNGVSQLNIELAPQLKPQSLVVLKNGQYCGINVENITYTYPPVPSTDCFESALNIYDFGQGEQMYPGGFRNGYYASHPLSVNAGDVISIDINHPQYCESSSWGLKIICAGSSNKPINNTFELSATQENMLDLDMEPLNRRVLSTSRVRFYPNPFSKGINLEFASATNDHLNLEVYNYLGTKVFAKSLDVVKGQNLRYIDEFENVPSGVYIIKITSENNDFTTRVIKLE